MWYHSYVGYTSKSNKQDSLTDIDSELVVIGEKGGGNRGTRGQICGDRNIILGGEHTCNIYDMLTQHLKLIRFC